MKINHKFVLCIVLVASSIIFSCSLINPPLKKYSREICDSGFQLRTSANLTLDEILAYPSNFTYSLKPLTDVRYFGSNVFELNITQTNGTATSIKIEIGQFINTTKSELQNMTIAKQEWINLSGAGDSKVVNLTVFCINVQGEVPQRSDNYFIVSQNATGDLALVLIYINANSLFNYHYAQLAVWAASDGPNQIPSGYIYNNTEVAWANALLAAAGTSLIIPDVPIIPGFDSWFLLLGVGFVLIPYIGLRKRRRR